jgi:hypothetical protein
MSTPFRRVRGVVTATFHAAEVDLLASLVGQLVELVADGQPSLDEEDPLQAALQTSSPEPPEDPVLARLFPDGYSDPRYAADFRRFTEHSLRRLKIENAQVVLGALESAEHRSRDRRRVQLDEAAALAWLRVFTDLRLALGTRLGLSEDDEGETGEGEPEETSWAEEPSESEQEQRRYVRDVYDWLSALQETLVGAVATP